MARAVTGLAQLIPLGVAALAAVPGLLAYRQSQKAKTEADRLERAKVDAQAYEDARKIYQAAIEQLERTVERTRTELDEERRRRRELEQTSERTIEGLRKRVASLEQELLRFRRPGNGTTSKRA